MGSNVGIKNFQIWNLELKLEYLQLLHETHLMYHSLKTSMLLTSMLHTIMNKSTCKQPNPTVTWHFWFVYKYFFKVTRAELWSEEASNT